MTCRRAHVTGLVALALMCVSCGRYAQTPSPSAEPRPLPSTVLYCQTWTTPCEGCAGVTKSRETTGFDDIDVVIHVMSAQLGDSLREQEYSSEREWVMAPTDDALTTGAETIVDTSKPPVWVEYWTPRMIDLFFGRSGKVNEIWTRHNIQLVLRKVEDCRYYPEQLRPDGSLRDSMLTPQTSTPWASKFFNGVNRLFTEEQPRALHVFLWWSLVEGDIDGQIPSRGVIQKGKKGNGVWGYSRSAARGGPAVWIGSNSCFQPSPNFDSLGRCAAVLAHEVGHALGLQHVDVKTNLMYENIILAEHWGVVVTASQGEQARREAREQFGSK
jgi:Matrixin